ncbi:MAG: His/Gly/Thr/Pro-type tRNA ligase C-terminal domain-containing protein, partial [Gemmatimonadota bacterium]
VMTHGDDTGLVLPPRLAPLQAVIVPIWRDDEQKVEVLEAAERAAAELNSCQVRVHVDARDGMNPGAKYYEWERKGVPLRLEVGPRDVAQGTVMSVRRFTPEGEDRKRPIPQADLQAALPELLERMQGELFELALRRRADNTRQGIEDYDEFKALVEERGGFVFTGWCGDAACEQRVKEETKTTIRVIAGEDLASHVPPARCLCGAESQMEVVRARAY